ncbi:hypothetical protein JCM8547_004220 [Rhodosporidiobolus lusitaniae]
MTVYTSPWPKIDLPECSVWEKVWSNPTKQSDDHPAVIDGVSGKVLSRRDLKYLSQRLAHGFVHTAKLKKGDVVLAMSPNSIHYHAIVLATQCAGLVFSGANAAYTSAELAHQVEDSGAKLLLIHPSVLDVALSSTSSLGWSAQQQNDRIVLAAKSNELGSSPSKGFRTLEALISKELLEPVKIEKPKETVAYMCYSSGTSGKAKGVKTSAYNMTSVMTMFEPLKLYKPDVLVAVLPLNHIYGLTKLCHWPIMHANPVVILPRFELTALCTVIQRYKVTVLLLVPPIALLLARQPAVDKFDLSSLRLIISGAAPLGPELEEELAQKTGAVVMQGYGLTETSPTTHVGINAPRGSIGPLLPAMEARLVDPETGKDVARSETGELWLAGPNVMLGYHNRPEANEEMMIPDSSVPSKIWLRTGDIGHEKDDIWYISDRLKELIKVKGFQVPPAELEAALLACPYVADVAVIGVWNEAEQTEFPRGYVVLSAEGKKEKDAVAAIHQWTNGKIAAYKRLKGGIKLVEAVPKSPSGKILRRILRDEVKKEMATAKAQNEASQQSARI